MLNSMTGYGRSTAVLSGREITVEIRCVNHRYFEPTVKTPRAYSWLEQPVKEAVQRAVQRGKLEAGVTVITRDAEDAQVQANVSVARGYLNAMRGLSGELGVRDDVTVGSLARFSDIFTVQKTEIDEHALWNDVSQVLQQALERFSAMRADEGKSLGEDIAVRLDTIEKTVGEIEKLAAENQRRYFERLYAKLREVLENRNIDETRVLQEAAIFADKAAVDEETVRLRSHIEQMRGFLKSEIPVGKKMDFLVQEFNREANTIGSKANNIELTRIVVELKSEIEKMREQVQNIE